MTRYQYGHRPTAYIDHASGHGTTDAGEPIDAGAHPRLPAVLRALPPDIRRVFMVGARPSNSADGLYSWILDSDVGQEWHDNGTYLDHAAPAVRLVDRATGKRRVELYRAAAWFGEGDYTPAAVREAFATLEGMLKHCFDQHATVLTTPGSTGRDLWDRAPHPEAPVLDAETRTLIKAQAGQGRTEVCTLPELRIVPGIYCYDGILMYGGLCKDRELPIGPVQHDTVPEIVPYARARYKVLATVPADWAHLGLLPLWDDAAERWIYPSTPGQTFTTWCDGAEAELAIRQGWQIAVRERLLFGKAKVLDTWARRLLGLRDQATEMYRRGELSEIQGKLLTNALRAILLHTIGVFGRVQRPQVHYFHPADTYLIDAKRCIGAPHPLPNGMWVAEYEPEPVPAAQERFMHPEWAAAIYAVTRCRLLDYRTQQAGALTVERSGVLALRTDAIYLNKRQPWQGTIPGQFRLKGAIEKRTPAPHSEDALLRLADRLEGVYDGQR